MNIYPHLLAIEEPFPAVLLDAFGVFWAGNALGPIPGAKETMAALVQQGTIVGILSNSTQPSSKEIAKFALYGLHQGSHFHFVVTSGDVARALFLSNRLPFHTHRKKYFLLGGTHPKYSSHTAIFHETGFTETEHLHEAEFLYVNVPHINGEDQTDAELFHSQVKEVLHAELPMVCANPDRFAHEGSPLRAVVRQGSIAAIYEKEGREVFYIGKPEKAAYEMAFDKFRAFNVHNPAEILMVGDTPETDIRGANRAGMPSALITEYGIMSDRVQHHGFEQAIQLVPKADYPEYFIGRL